MEPENDDLPPRAALIAGVIFEASLIVVALGLGSLVDVNPLATFRPDLRAAAIGAAAAVPMLAFFLFALKSRAAPLVALRDALDQHLLPIFRDASATDVFALSALAGIGEEMLFRGVLQSSFAGFAGPTMGLVAASVLFGLAHSVTRAYAVVATLIGAFLGALWLFTGNLLAVIVAHALYDFVALTVYLLDARRRAVRQ